MDVIPLAVAIGVLDAELSWCMEHPDAAFHAEYRKGFTNGLIQAKYLLTGATVPHMDDDDTISDAGEEVTSALDAAWDLHKKLEALKRFGRLWAIAATEAEKLQAWIAYAMTTVDDTDSTVWPMKDT